MGVVTTISLLEGLLTDAFPAKSGEEEKEEEEESSKHGWMDGNDTASTWAAPCLSAFIRFETSTKRRKNPR